MKSNETIEIYKTSLLDVTLNEWEKKISTWAKIIGSKWNEKVAPWDEKV